VDISRETITQASQGDLKAFEQIYGATSGFVYSVAYRIVNNRADAQEVTQDAFMQIYRNLKNFKFQSSFKTWAYRIATNTAINKYRQGSRERMRLQGYEQEARRQPAADAAVEYIDQENAEKKVSSLLQMLDTDQRACIVLREIEGLSYKEMASALNININTVRSRLKRARQALMERAQRRAG
jgi:RNA polymerase sigma-70 factor, ECF subfamily